MLIGLLPLSLAVSPTVLAGVGLWSLALYLGFSPVSDRLIEQLDLWLNTVERSLYASTEEFEQTQPNRDSLNAYYASLLSVVPFLLAGALCNWGVEISLGGSWAISMGVLACMGCGVYELGRQDGRSQE
jgi:hypothetical protein